MSNIEEKGRINISGDMEYETARGGRENIENERKHAEKANV